MRLFVSVSCAIALCLAGAGETSAQARTSGLVVLVVETGGARFHRARVAAAIEAELGVVVGKLSDDDLRSARGTINIDISRRGRSARIVYMPADGPAYAVRVDAHTRGRPDVFGRWLVKPTVAVVRTSDERRRTNHASSELLDPWIAIRVLGEPERARLLASHRDLLDPYIDQDSGHRVDVEIRDYMLGSDVLDPWAAEEARESRAEPRYGRVARPGARQRTAVSRAAR